MWRKSVTRETEVKIAIRWVEEFVVKMQDLDAVAISARHFEDNFVLDFADARLRNQGCLLRVRQTEQEESVTFKGPASPSMLFKSREELETEVGSAATMLSILERLGMRIGFRYQKYRQEYSLHSPAAGGGKVEVAVDSTPIGDFAELEGEEADILAVAEKLEIQTSQFIRESYHSLFLRYCQEHGRIAENMIF
jgi:adenylate cyclase class 2